MKKVIVVVAIVLLVIGISSFVTNAGEKGKTADVKTQKEEPLCYKVASMIKDGTINKYVPEKIAIPEDVDPHGSEYPNIDIDGDGIADKITVSSGSESSYLEVKLANGREYDLDESGFIKIVKLNENIYALVTYWKWERQPDGSRKGERVGNRLYELSKSGTRIICDLKEAK